MKNVEMLDELRRWFKANADRLRGDPVTAKLRRSETEDETLTPPLFKGGFDVQTDKILADFTVWGTGEVSVIMISSESGEHLIVEDRTIESAAELTSLLDYYTNLIVRDGPFTLAP